VVVEQPDFFKFLLNAGELPEEVIDINIIFTNELGLVSGIDGGITEIIFEDFFPEG
jgi:hypothetical protein